MYHLSDLVIIAFVSVTVGAAMGLILSAWFSANDEKQKPRKGGKGSANNGKRTKGTMGHNDTGRGR
jgi:hypothetical protein